MTFHTNNRKIRTDLEAETENRKSSPEETGSKAAGSCFQRRKSDLKVHETREEHGD